MHVHTFNPAANPLRTNEAEIEARLKAGLKTAGGGQDGRVMVAEEIYGQLFDPLSGRSRETVADAAARTFVFLQTCEADPELAPAVTEQATGALAWPVHTWLSVLEMSKADSTKFGFMYGVILRQALAAGDLDLAMEMSQGLATLRAAATLVGPAGEGTKATRSLGRGASLASQEGLLEAVLIAAKEAAPALAIVALDAVRESIELRQGKRNTDELQGNILALQVLDAKVDSVTALVQERTGLVQLRALTEVVKEGIALLQRNQQIRDGLASADWEPRLADALAGFEESESTLTSARTLKDQGLANARASIELADARNHTLVVATQFKHGDPEAIVRALGKTYPVRDRVGALAVQSLIRRAVSKLSGEVSEQRIAIDDALAALEAIDRQRG